MSQATTTPDLAVIGAGPAGLAAAICAAERGLSVAMIDEQPAPGGQIYRAIEEAMRTRPALSGILGADYRRGLDLVGRFRAAGVDYRPQTTAWHVATQRSILTAHAAGADELSAGWILIATGAAERPMPFPGWTLPGVLSAGGAQIALKSGGLVPTEPVVLAGTGPLLVLLAAQYLAAGAPIRALLDTSPPESRRQALRHVMPALRAPEYLVKGLGLMARLRRSGVPVHRGVTALGAIGRERLEAVTFRAASRREERIEAKLLIIHQGIVPNLQIPLALGCRVDFNAELAAWQPEVDAWGVSSVEGFSIAGDGAGILGARAAEATGCLAALEIAHRLGRLSRAERDRLAAPHRRLRDRHAQARPFLDALFRPPAAFRCPEDDATLVCRCEEVTAGRIRDMVRLGFREPNQIKAFTRCGMGPCQGRNCSLTVAEVIAKARGIPVEEAGLYRQRSPLKPIALGTLASLDSDEGNVTINIHSIGQGS